MRAGTSFPFAPTYREYLAGGLGFEPRLAESESTSPDDQPRGIPDAWIYTQSSDAICVLIEVKTRGFIDLGQIQRHKRSHFGDAGATFENIDLRWKDVSRAIHRAHNNYPNVVTAELLTFLSLEGLAATLMFDDATVHFARGKLPKDVMDELVTLLKARLGLNDDQLVAFPSDFAHVLIFRNFESVGNIEVWLDGDSPEVHVRTELSLGTSTPRYNLLSMPDQIERVLENLRRSDLVQIFLDRVKMMEPRPVWTVLDRLQFAQTPDWDARTSQETYQLLQAAGREVTPDVLTCFGDDHKLSASELERVACGLRTLHRAGRIVGGRFDGYRIFARVYFGARFVPAYGRSPQDVVPQVADHCVTWYGLLRTLSGANQI